MAKKAIILTLLEKNHGIKSFGLNPKAFSESNEYINVLRRSLDKKGVIITNFFFVNDANTFKLKLQIFFKAQRIKKYRKKLKLVRRRRFKWKFFWSGRKRGTLRRTEREKSIPSWKKKHVKKDRLKKKKGRGLVFWNRVAIKKAKQTEKITKETQKTQKKKPMPFKPWEKFSKGKKKFLIKRKKKAKKHPLKIKARLSVKKYEILSLRIKKKLRKTEKRTKTFKGITKFLPINNLLIHEFEVLNKQVIAQIYLTIHNVVKRFKRMLFSRRDNLYIDFLNMTSLFVAKKINLAAYNAILGTIFKFLLKKSHSKFFAFLKKLFTFLMKVKIISGIRININGKLKGKLRAKTYTLTVGRVGTHEANSNIEFSKIHIHTLYGCFGFKTLVKYKNSTKIYAVRSKKVKV